MVLLLTYICSVGWPNTKGPLPLPLLGRLPTDNILLAFQLTWGLHVDDYTQAQCCACHEHLASLQVWRQTLVQLLTEHLVRLCKTLTRHLNPLVSLLSDSGGEDVGSGMSLSESSCMQGLALLSWPLLVVDG